MSHQQHRDLQQQILDAVLNILRDDPHVLGVSQTGSLFKGDHDAFSDIDVDCYMVNEGSEGIQQIIAAVMEAAPLLAKLWVYGKHALFLYENGVRLDLNFNKPADIAWQKWDACTILYDPQGALESGFDRSATPGRHPHPPWTPEDFEYLDWYFWMFRQVYAWAKRAEQANHKAFNKLSNAIDSLGQIRNGIVETRLWLHGSWDYVLTVDPGLAERLAKTYPHFEVAEVLHCTRLLLEEVRELCHPYCEKRGIPYPTHKLEVMERILNEFDTLS